MYHSAAFLKGKLLEITGGAAVDHSYMHGPEGRQARHAAVLSQEVVPPAPDALLGPHLAGELLQAGCSVHLEILEHRQADLAGLQEGGGF